MQWAKNGKDNYGWNASAAQAAYPRARRGNDAKTSCRTGCTSRWRVMEQAGPDRLSYVVIAGPNVAEKSA